MSDRRHSKDPAHASSHQILSSVAHSHDLKDWHCIALLIALVFIFFRNILLGNAFLWEDFLYDYAPRNFAAVSLAQGEIPLWNPYSFNGMPFLADIQKAVFYPPCTALTLFVQGDRLPFYSVELLLILHYLLAGISMFYLARSFSLERVPSLLAGVAYMLSGFMVMHAIHLYIITLVAWYPLILLLFRKALTGSWKWTFIAGPVLGASTLAGFPQLSLYFYSFLFVFFVFELLTTYRGRSLLTRPAITATAKAGLIVALSVSVALLQLLPTIEFAGLTFRAQITYQKSVEGEFSWQQLITFLFPKFFGTAGATGYNYYGPGTYWYYWETCMYLGILPLTLMVMSARLFRSNKYIGFFWAVSIFAVLYALGSHFPLHKIFFNYIPGFATFRNPSRIGILLTFSAALLAGFGLQHLLSASHSRSEIRGLKTIVLAVMGTSLLSYFLFVSGALSNILPFLENRAFFAVTSSSMLASLVVIISCGILLLSFIKQTALSRWAGIAASLALAIDMIVFAGDQNNSKTDPDAYYDQAKPIVDFIKNDSHGELVRANIRNEKGMLMDRNQGLIDRIMLMEGYTPLVLQRYLPPSRDWSQTCDMMNAKYRTVTDEAHHSVMLTRATTYLPRAYMVYHDTIVTDSALIYRFMESEAFEPSRVVVIESDPMFSPNDTAYTSQWSVQFTSYKLNSMALTVSTPKDGFLVFSEVYYPGWIAFVDDTPVPIYRANWNQRALPIRAGEHLVRMEFVSPPFRRGSWISIGTLLVCAVGITAPLVRQRLHKQ